MFALDLLPYVLVTMTVVISVQLTDRLGQMMVLAPVIGGFSALVGLYLSWSIDLPAGGTIVLVATAVFLACWLVAPRGLLALRLDCTAPHHRHARVADDTHRAHLEVGLHVTDPQ